MFGEVVQDRAKRAQRDVGGIGSEMTVAVVEQLELFEPDGDRARHLFDRGEVVAEGGPVHVCFDDGRDRRNGRRTRCKPGDGSCHGSARARPARLPVPVCCVPPPRAPGRIQTCAHGFGGRRPSARDLARCPPLTMPRKQMADGPVSRSRTTIRVQHGRPTHDRGRRPERRRCARRRCRDRITECVPSARTQRRCVRSASPILPLPDSVIAPPAARLDNRHRGR